MRPPFLFPMTKDDAIKKLMSVISYYASNDTWELYLDGQGNHSTECDASANDRGRRARKVLKELQNVELRYDEQLIPILKSNNSTQTPQPQTQTTQ